MMSCRSHRTIIFSCQLGNAVDFELLRRKLTKQTKSRSISSSFSLFRLVGVRGLWRTPSNQQTHSTRVQFILPEDENRLITKKEKESKKKKYYEAHCWKEGERGTANEKAFTRWLNRKKKCCEEGRLDREKNKK